MVNVSIKIDMENLEPSYRHIADLVCDRAALNINERNDGLFSSVRTINNPFRKSRKLDFLTKWKQHIVYKYSYMRRQNHPT